MTGERESQHETTNSLEQLSPEDLIATITEQQKGSTNEKEKQGGRDDGVDPVALERGQRFVPRGAFAAGGRNHSARSLVTNGTPGDVPLEAILVNPHQASSHDDDILTAQPIESVGNDGKQPEELRWTAQIWCRYCLAALCLLTVLAMCIAVGILALREGGFGRRGGGGPTSPKEMNDRNDAFLEPSLLWYSHHGVSLGSRTGCSLPLSTIPYVNFTLQCPINTQLKVHHTSISMVATDVDTSTLQVSVPLGSDGHVALDCIRESTSPRIKVDLTVTMEEIVVQGCHGGPVGAFALFLRRCGDRNFVSRASIDCGLATPGIREGLCIIDEYEDCYSEATLCVADDDGDDCSHTAACLPEVTVEDRTKCEESPYPQDTSFLNAIQSLILNNFVDELQEFNSLQHGNNNTEDEAPWG